jgi:hypothetical protein
MTTTTKQKRRHLSESEREAIIAQLKWSQPLGLTKWAKIYGVHPNTMRAWLKDQVVRNERMSPRFWRIAIEDLPADLVLNALAGTTLPDT